MGTFSVRLSIPRRLLPVCNPEVEWRERGLTRTLDYVLGNNYELRNIWLEAKETWKDTREERRTIETLKGLLMFSTTSRQAGPSERIIGYCFDSKRGITVYEDSTNIFRTFIHSMISSSSRHGYGFRTFSVERCFGSCQRLFIKSTDIFGGQNV